MRYTLGACLGVFEYRPCVRVIEMDLNICPARKTRNQQRPAAPDINWWHGQPILIVPGYSYCRVPFAALRFGNNVIETVLGACT